MEKVNNKISFKTKSSDQINTEKKLKTIKHYYADITSFLISEQGKNRNDQLERQYVKELE